MLKPSVLAIAIAWPTLALCPAFVEAQQYTYELIDDMVFAAPWEFHGGTITTKTNSGALTADDIIAFEMSFTSPIDTYTLSSDDGGSANVFSQLLIASEEGLTINKALEPLETVIEFQDAANRQKVLYSNQAMIDLFDSALAAASDLAAPPNNVATFALEIPEPSTLAGSLVALLAVGGIRTWKKTA
ncbi:MAG: hypothetical protein AAF961_11060 [Planctomycetota bacterium]